MKKILNIALASMLVLGMAACHEPEYVLPNESASHGILSIRAIFPDGEYNGQILATLNNSDPEATYYDLEIPWYYPSTSDNTTLQYITNLRVQASIAPNYKLEPGLTLLDLTEENHFNLVKPDGTKMPIVITGHRVKPKDCSLITFTISELMVDGIIDEEKMEVLIPYKEDLSAYSFSGQVSPHAKIGKVGTQAYVEGKKYDLNDGQTVTVIAGDDTTEGVYTLRQGDPELIDMGINVNSFKLLFNEDPVSILGMPAYDQTVYISLAGIGSNLIVCTGTGDAPVLVNRFNGAKAGTMNVGSAVADVIAGDEAEHVLIANCADAGETVNIYVSSDVKTAPVLLGSFVNPLDGSGGAGIGHKMKVIGNVENEAVVVFTAEGIPEVTTASRAVYVHIKNGAIDGEPQSVNFSSLGFAWGAAPVNVATVAAASLEPEHDGWFLDYYEGNADDDGYILHHVSPELKDTKVSHLGDWASNPNCLDVKRFNNSTFMVLMAVSHFPMWGTGPKIRFFDSSDPKAPSVLKDDAPTWFQTGASGVAGGDICICPSSDGFRMFIYYYDHNSQAVGAYVVDCIKK